MQQSRIILNLLMAFGLILLWGGGIAHAQTGPGYSVAVDTSSLTSLSPQPGYLVFSFSSSSGMLDAAADITNFQLTGDSLVTDTSVATGNGSTGLVTGDVNAGDTLTLHNNDGTGSPGAFSAFTQGLDFGSDSSVSRLSFDVAFSGPAFDPSNSLTDTSTFAVYFFDNALSTSLLQDDSLSPTGEALDINIVNPNGQVSASNSSMLSNGSRVLTIGPLTPSGGIPAVPEPSPLITLAVGMPMLLAFRLFARRRQSQA